MPMPWAWAWKLSRFVQLLKKIVDRERLSRIDRHADIKGTHTAQQIHEKESPLSLLNDARFPMNPGQRPSPLDGILKVAKLIDQSKGLRRPSAENSSVCNSLYLIT